MTALEQLLSALAKADAAGNVEDARMLAAAVRRRTGEERPEPESYPISEGIADLPVQSEGPTEPGFVSGVQTGTGSYEAILPSVGYALGDEKQRDEVVKLQQEEAERKRAHPELHPTYEDTKSAWTNPDVSFYDAVGKTQDWVAYTLGEQVARMGPGVASAAIGARGAAAIAPLPYKPIAAVIGGGLGLMESMHIPELIQGQVAEQEAAKARGEAGNDLDRTRLGIAAVANTALDVGQLSLIAGKFPIIRTIIGLAGKTPATAIASKLAKESWKMASAKGAAMATIAELPQEIAQTMVERWHLKKELLSDEAFEEYEQTAATVAAVAPFLGAPAGIHAKYVAGKDAENVGQKEKAKATIAAIEAEQARRVKDQGQESTKTTGEPLGEPLGIPPMESPFTKYTEDITYSDGSVRTHTDIVQEWDGLRRSGDVKAREAFEDQILADYRAHYKRKYSIHGTKGGKQIKPKGAPPTGIPPTGIPPTGIPPTDIPPTDIPPTDIPPADIPLEEAKKGAAPETPPFDPFLDASKQDTDVANISLKGTEEKAKKVAAPKTPKTPKTPTESLEPPSYQAESKGVPYGDLGTGKGVGRYPTPDLSKVKIEPVETESVETEPVGEPTAFSKFVSFSAAQEASRILAKAKVTEAELDTVIKNAEKIEDPVDKWTAFDGIGRAEEATDNQRKVASKATKSLKQETKTELEAASGWVEERNPKAKRYLSVTAKHPSFKARQETIVAKRKELKIAEGERKNVNPEVAEASTKVEDLENEILNLEDFKKIARAKNPAAYKAAKERGLTDAKAADTLVRWVAPTKKILSLSHPKQSDVQKRGLETPEAIETDLDTRIKEAKEKLTDAKKDREDTIDKQTREDPESTHAHYTARINTLTKEIRNEKAALAEDVNAKFAVFEFSIEEETRGSKTTYTDEEKAGSPTVKPVTAAKQEQQAEKSPTRLTEKQRTEDALKTRKPKVKPEPEESTAKDKEQALDAQVKDLQKKVDELTTKKPLDFERRVTGRAKPDAGYSVAEAEQQLQPLIRKKRLHNLNIKVVATASALPESVRNGLENLNQTLGVYDQATDTVYIVADQHSTKEQLMETLAHEAMGHAGFARLFQDNYTKSADTLFNDLGGVDGIRALAEKLGVSEDLAPYLDQFETSQDKTMLVEEFLAVTQGKEANRSVSAKVWNAIKRFFTRMQNWFKGKGFVDLANQDVNKVRQLLKEMHRAASGVTLKAPTEERTAVLQSAKETAGKMNLEDKLGFVRGREAGKGETNSIKSKTDKELEEELAELQIRLTMEAAPDEKARKKALTTWLDKFETKVFSSDAAIQNALRKAIESDATLNREKVIQTLIALQLGQTVNSGAFATQFLHMGKGKYDEDSGHWVAEVDERNNLKNVLQAIENMLTNHSDIPNIETAQQIAHTYFEAFRIKDLRENHNAKILSAIDRAEARIDKANDVIDSTSASKPERDEAKNTVRKATQEIEKTRKKLKKLHMSEEQEAMALSFVKDYKELAVMHEIWQGVRENVVDVMVQGGRYSEAQADDLLAAVGYVPFYREVDEEGTVLGPQQYISGLQVQMNKAFKGSGNPVNNIFQNMEQWIISEVNRSVHNKSGVLLAQAAEKYQLADKVEADKISDKPNVTRVFIDGEPKYFSMKDPLFMDAFRGLDGAAIRDIYPIFAEASNRFRRFIVLNPIFSITQIPMDSVEAIFSSGLKPQYAWKIPFEAMKEMVSTVFGTSATHKKLKPYGVVGRSDWSDIHDYHDSNLQKEIDEGAPTADKGFWKWMKPKLEGFSMAADNSVRQAVYNLAIQQGLTHAEALTKAWEIINFRRQGSMPLIRLASQIIPFQNAYLQAMYVLEKTITMRGISPQKRNEAMSTYLTLSVGAMTLGALYAMLNADDEKYTDERHETRNRRFVVPGVFSEGTPVAFGFPVRKSIFLLPKVLGEHMYLMYTDKLAGGDAKHLRSALSDTIVNGVFGPAAYPQLIKPLYEVYGSGKSSFTGLEIIPKYFEGVNYNMQYTARTSEFAKSIGAASEWVTDKTFIPASWQVSPLRVDHIIRGYTGSLAGVFNLITNEMYNSSLGRAVTGLPIRPETYSSMSVVEIIAQLPSMRAWLARAEGSTKNDYYEIMKLVKKTTNSWRDLRESDPEGAEEFYVQNEDILAYRTEAVGFGNHIQEGLADIRNKINAVHKSKDPVWTQAKKAARIKELKKDERDFLRDMRDEVKKIHTALSPHM